ARAAASAPPLAVIAALGPGLVTAMFAIGLVYMPRFFRLTRATTHDLNAEMFIRAERSLGARRTRVLFGHILPNAMPPLIVQVSLVFGTAILAEASLSFLGLGVKAPTASWGSMLADASTRLDKSYLIWGPGIALTITVLAFAMVGDGLRDALGIGRTVK
ncbi:MAG TPA: ABC transporter permease, partial [Ilumatobacteraceae bacterium]|nr:ABC transporter permease [Ilumatobacteraceae bacterium]